MESYCMWSFVFHFYLYYSWYLEIPLPLPKNCFSPSTISCISLFILPSLLLGCGLLVSGTFPLLSYWASALGRAAGTWKAPSKHLWDVGLPCTGLRTIALPSLQILLSAPTSSFLLSETFFTWFPEWLSGLRVLALSLSVTFSDPEHPTSPCKPSHSLSHSLSSLQLS